MHYIIGTSFSVTQKNKHPSFTAGQTYVLQYIKMTSSQKREYIFKCNPRTPAVVLEFNSCEEGDQFIARMRGETLPNYTEAYKKISG